MFLIRRITGHSMLPKFRPGDIIVARPWLVRPKVGAVVVLEHDGIEKVKRIVKLDAAQVYVEGDNPAASKDSRHFGWLGKECIKAVVIWPR